jgi:hypothetical protein
VPEQRLLYQDQHLFVTFGSWRALYFKKFRTFRRPRCCSTQTSKCCAARVRSWQLADTQVCASDVRFRQAESGRRYACIDTNGFMSTPYALHTALDVSISELYDRLLSGLAPSQRSASDAASGRATDAEML